MPAPKKSLIGNHESDYQLKVKPSYNFFSQLLARPQASIKFSHNTFLALILAIFVIFNIFIFENLQSTQNFSNHLSTQNIKHNQTPQDLTLKQQLSQKFNFTQEIKQINTSEKIVALTFDDGPSPATLKILDILKEEQVPATFFVIGKWVDKYPHIIKQIDQQGHEIGNHSNTHPDLSNLDKNDVFEEIVVVQKKIHTLTGQESIYFRSPYGVYPENFFELNQWQLQLFTIGWSSDPQDWKKQNSKQIMETINNEVSPGSIIVLHDGPPEVDRQQTVKILPEIINQLKDDGYQFVSLTDLLLAEDDNISKKSLSVTPPSP